MTAPSAEALAREMVARWEHGSDEHRKWLRDMCVPEISNFIVTERAAAYRRGIDDQRKALRDYIHRLEALGEIKPSSLSNDAVVKGIILELRALAPPQEGSP